MDIPKIVLDAAHKHGLGEMEYIGNVDGAQVYGERGQVDEDGFPIPTGLPCLILLKDGKTDFVGGVEALQLLGRFD